MVDYAVLRKRMVNNQLRTFDVTDHRIQDAMASIPREDFVPASQRPLAYSDADLPIDDPAPGQRGRFLLRPAAIARLIQEADMKPQDVVLVVGAGTGYSTAVVATMVNSVVALECDQDLAKRATASLEAHNVENAAVVIGPLRDGYPSEAPFDVILIDGAVEDGLEPLFAQLKSGGRLVTVEGTGLSAAARVYTRSGDAVSGWSVFNAAAPLLPGFEKAAGFVF